MRNEFTAVVERDGRWYVAHGPEIPGANGQGRTKAAVLKNLSEAIALILEDRRRMACVAFPQPHAERRSLSAGEARKSARI